MDLTVTIGTNQQTLSQFLGNHIPRSGVAASANPKLFVLGIVVEGQCVQAPTITTKPTTTTQELDRSAFQALPLLRDVILLLASRRTEAPLPSDQNGPAAMPGTTFRNSRL